MSDFKVGDQVVCTDAVGVEDYLLKDSTYIISAVEEDNEDVYLGLVGVFTREFESEFFAHRFVLIKEKNNE